MPRTSLFVIAAAAAATCALSACGPVRMGAAAITGGQRITVTTLSDQVTNLEQAYQAGKSAIQLQFPLSEAPQEVLGWMLRFRISDELAARNHLTVTNGAGERALSSLARSTGRTGHAFIQLVVANGLPPDMLPALGRYEAIQTAELTALNNGTAPTTQQRVQALTPAFSHRECVAAKTLSIQVNPQFGALDYNSISVIAARSPLSAPPTPAPSPSIKPQLTPAC